MSNRQWLWGVAVLAMALSVQGSEVIFVPVKIDGPVHDPAQHSFWFGPFCECASVLDVDGDGDLDLAAGRNWYEAPDWTRHANFRDGAETNGPETDDNSEFAMDVNFDGRPDIVSSGWMFLKGAFWYENPGKKDVVWKSTRIHQAVNMEGVIHGDIDGDGDDDILCNHWALVKGQGMTWLEHINKEPWFVEHVVGTQGDVHGNGLGDINGDGRVDIVTQVGWYEQPQRASDTPWAFHADYTFTSDKNRGGPASHPILVYDVDGDGHNDIIIGASHNYGLAWLQQKVDGAGKRTFTEHWIETDYSQFHTLALGDLNGDGKPDMVTGKRLFAHHGRDIGAFDPLYTFWYDIKGGQFERHVVSYNHLPYYPEEGGINPPPNYVVSAGMKLNIADMNKDGRNDIIIAGKGGLYVFYNEGNPPKPPRLHKLAQEETYPSWREWPAYEVLFNSKDLTGWKVREGDNGHWKVVDGVIEYDGKSEGKADKALWTTESFQDFSLHVEWRVKRSQPGPMSPLPNMVSHGFYKGNLYGRVIQVPLPATDSGVLVRGADVGEPDGWIQDMGTPEECDAALRKLQGSSPFGRWNSYDITVVGDRLTIMLNGATIAENRQVRSLATSGRIGLQQGHSLDSMHPAANQVQFRNILLRKLPRQERPQAARPNADADGFVTLFNGKDLTGWHSGPDHSWIVQDGVLTVTRAMDGKEHNSDYLWTNETYGDFILDLEFKVTEGTNSGIFFRTADTKDPVYTGIEVQICDSYGRSALSRTGTAGAVYDCLAPTKNAIKPRGEWNHCRLTCRGSRVEVVLNGEKIIDMNVDDWTKASENPGGTSNKFSRAIKDFARVGYLGLQDHGRPVSYRNIRIKRL